MYVHVRPRTATDRTLSHSLGPSPRLRRLLITMIITIIIIIIIIMYIYIY